MPDQYISCPNCGQKIPLSEAFTREIEDKLRKQFERDTQKKDIEHKQALEAQKKESLEVFNREKQKAEDLARQKAQESVAVQLKDLMEQNQEKTKQLEAARQQELDLRRRQRELEERERSSQLEMERKLDEERKSIWNQALTKTADEQRMKMLEKDKQLDDMRKQIEELKRKSELTSQQAQGEVQEVELEHVLVSQFRFDKIEPVPKGIRGADIIQNVHDDIGRYCGKIVWESKRTKEWSDAWIQKLKDDQRAVKAEVAVLVSRVLPKEINRFGYVDGIWASDFASAIGLATALRMNLIQVSSATNTQLSRNDKKEMIYNYLFSPEFRQRVEAIAEAYTAMKSDLDAERTAMQKIWTKREKQIDRVLKNVAGLHGDLEGIIGSSLPEIKILELPSSPDSQPA
ncbi:MAG: DUF2130 domain-containing protein [Ignavibacteriae bacterium]|nr:DUF2130 domain-containing protein [Ignavibacteria bacterium]MBI3364528.1 DUF2130 domain-containing protein [Ignavibacteriota bacterium]